MIWESHRLKGKEEVSLFFGSMRKLGVILPVRFLNVLNCPKEKKVSFSCRERRLTRRNSAFPR